MKMKLNLLLSSSLIVFQFEIIICHDFHRDTTGVAFSAYAGNTLNWTEYSLNDVKAMIKLISGRFSKITTFGVGADPKITSYQWNSTYYQSYSQVYSAEAAALLNKEMSHSGTSSTSSDLPPIQMYIGIWLHDDIKQQETEVHLAMESAQKANAIYPRTVQGLIFGHRQIDTDLHTATLALDQLENLKPETSKQGIKLGTRQSCTTTGLGKNDRERLSSPLTQINTKIVNISDFIICEVNPIQAFGVTPGFAYVKNKLLNYSSELKAINPNIDVMGQTGWAGKFKYQFDVDALKAYWLLADEWAEQQNFTLWMFEAFDNECDPWKGCNEDDDNAGNFGWWKLTEEGKAGMETGYIEKISRKPNQVAKSSGSTTVVNSSHEGSNEPSDTRHESRSDDATTTEGKESGKNGAELKTRAVSSIYYFASFVVIFFIEKNFSLKGIIL